jgi:drug/metabolite transporter (DMT)-like permease
MTIARKPARSSLPAVLALVASAFIWGTVWWPLRQLGDLGWHPLQSSAILFSMGAVAIAIASPGSVGRLAKSKWMWVLAIASAITNASFNWGIVIGDVVRVILLFYTMPLWALLLARILLRERLTRASALRVLMAMAGVAIVLRPASGLPWPWPASLADWLGLTGGFFFALTSVLLRRVEHETAGAIAFAMFAGSALVTGACSVTLLPGPWLPPLPWQALAIAAGLASFLLLGNMALQYGAVRLPMRVTAVVMLTEVVFATGSSVALGAGILTPGVFLGAGLILLAGVLSAGEGRG